MSNNLFEKRVYGVVIIKSKLANYNADFTGSPRTLPDGTVYATDKVLKFKIRDYLEKSGKKVFVKTKYKEDGNPMTLDEIYKYHFNEDTSDKRIVLKNLLSMLDIRLFGVTFAKKGDNNLNLSIHGPVQISYGVNRFIEMKDSGMFTDQIGSQFASKEGDSQTTLGAQTRSFEAHYVHHFSINPKNLSMFVEQFLKEIKKNYIDVFSVTKKKNNKDILDKDTIKKRIKALLKNNQNLLKKLEKIDEKKVNDWEDFIKRESIDFKDDVFSLVKTEDISCLKEALQVAVTAYDSTSKKDAENEFLMWIELKENGDKKCSETVLKNFSELIEITKENGKAKIELEEVFKYLQNFKDCIEKIEIYYDSNFNIVDGIPGKKEWNGVKIEEFKTLGKIEKTK